MRADPVDGTNRSEEGGRGRGGGADDDRRPRPRRPGRCGRAAAGRRAAGLHRGHRVDRPALAGPLTGRERLRDPGPRPRGGLEIEAGEAGSDRRHGPQAGARHRLRGPGPRLQAQTLRAVGAERQLGDPAGADQRTPSRPRLSDLSGRRRVQPRRLHRRRRPQLRRDHRPDQRRRRQRAAPRLRLHPGVRHPLRRRPAGQPAVPVHYAAYGDESDRGPFPVPPGAPVEGGNGSDGDRHVLVVRRPAEPGGAASCTSSTAPSTGRAATTHWNADSGAAWDLAPARRSRPDGWTSADAAGLPIFPGLVRYEEVAAGHDRPRDPGHLRRAPATPRSTPPPTAPATPAARAAPPMGLRLRLKAGYGLGGFSGAAKVIATAMKRYGLIVADNGSNWYISGIERPALGRRKPESAEGHPGQRLRGRRPGDRDLSLLTRCDRATRQMTARLAALRAARLLRCRSR